MMSPPAPHWRAYTFSFLPSCSGGCSLKNLNFPPKLGDMMGDISLFLEAVTDPILPYPLAPRAPPGLIWTTLWKRGKGMMAEKKSE